MTIEIQQKIRNHLIETKKEWEEHLSNKKIRFLLTLAWQTLEREEKAKQIIKWINETLGDEVLDNDNNESTLEKYKELYKNWNENQKIYDGSLDIGGNLLRLKDLLDKWENPPQPTLTEEQKKKLENYDELEKQVQELKKENEKFRNRELNDNEKEIIAIFPRALAGSGTRLDFRLASVKRALEQLKKNDLSIQATPNLSAQGISLSECLAANLAEIIWIGDFYFSKRSEWEEIREELEERIQELEAGNS